MTERRFVCFLAGFGAGIAAALLWAPKTGLETRATLKERAMQGQEYLKRQGAAVADTIHRGKEAAKTTTEGVIEALEGGKAVLRG